MATVVVSYTLHVKTPLMIATGLSQPGRSDNEAVRDAAGMPVDPRHSVRGAVRATLREICKLYSKDDPKSPFWVCDGEYDPPAGKRLCGLNVREGEGEERCVCCRLFGGPGTGPGKLTFENAVTPKAVTDLLNKMGALPDNKMKQQVQDAQSELRTHVGISPALRRGQEDILFVQESVRPLGGILEGRILLRSGQQPLTEFEETLLRMALRCTRGIGGKRRRGYGACVFKLAAPADQGDHTGDVPADPDWVGLHKRLGSGDMSVMRQAAVHSPAPISSIGKAWVEVKVEISTPRSALILGAGQQAGNLIRTQEYIAGTRLRGALGWAFFGTRPARDEWARRLFFSSECRFENCYPVQDGDVHYPTPLSVLTCKVKPGFSGDMMIKDGARHHAQDALLQTPADKCRQCGAPLERLGGYCSANFHWMEKPGTRRDTRTALDENQRAKTGALFTTEALDPGESVRLQGKIVMPGDLWSRLESALGGRDVCLTFGRGAAPAEVTFTVCEHDAMPTWHDHVPFEERWAEGSSDREFTVTLISDALLADDAFNPMLTMALPVCGVEPVRAVQGLRQVSGWNAMWNLPTEARWALSAGSAYLFRIEQEDQIQEVRSKLKDLENEGIGLRRNEGFGRLLVNLPLHRELGGAQE